MLRRQTGLQIYLKFLLLSIHNKALLQVCFIISSDCSKWQPQILYRIVQLLRLLSLPSTNQRMLIITFLTFTFIILITWAATSLGTLKDAKQKETTETYHRSQYMGRADVCNQVWYAKLLHAKHAFLQRLRLHETALASTQVSSTTHHIMKRKLHGVNQFVTILTSFQADNIFYHAIYQFIIVVLSFNICMFIRLTMLLHFQQNYVSTYLYLPQEMDSQYYCYIQRMKSPKQHNLIEQQPMPDQKEGPPSPSRNLKLTFNNLDEKKAGEINKKILTQAIMYTGDNYDKQIIRSEIEKCGDKISLDKFIQIFSMAEIQMNQLMENQSLFRLYDRARKGYIDKEDLVRVSELSGVELSEQQLSEMLNFNTVPGQVQFDQFAEIMNDQNAWF